jgi:hypothetical protein
MCMSRTVFKDRIERIALTITIFATVIGGAWALYNYVVTASATPALEIKINVSTRPYSVDKQLLAVSVTLKNVGKVPVKLTTKREEENTPRERRQPPGLNVGVNILPSNEPPGPMASPHLPTYSIHVADGINMPPIPPGISFQKTLFFVMERKDFYLVRAYAEYLDTWVLVAGRSFSVGAETIAQPGDASPAPNSGDDGQTDCS